MAAILGDDPAAPRVVVAALPGPHRRWEVRDGPVQAAFARPCNSTVVIGTRYGLEMDGSIAGLNGLLQIAPFLFPIAIPEVVICFIREGGCGRRQNHRREQEKCIWPLHIWSSRADSHMISWFCLEYDQRLGAPISPAVCPVAADGSCCTNGKL